MLRTYTERLGILATAVAVAGFILVGAKSEEKVKNKKEPAYNTKSERDIDPDKVKVPKAVQLDSHTVVLDDFSGSTLGEFPTGWRARGKNGIRFYRVAEGEDGTKYLKVDAIKDGTSIFRRVKWDLKKYPILEWRWRGRVLPLKGNEKRHRTNDNAAAVYIVFPVRWFLPDSLKYSWSTTLPVGTEFANGRRRNQIFVLRSGTKDLGKWVTERRNVYEDYKRRFRRKVPNPIAIGVITDADQTKSASSGDYDYFKIKALDDAKVISVR